MSHRLFTLSRDALDAEAPFRMEPVVGTCVTFAGLVRDHNEGKPVVALEYTAYVALAEREGERIVREAVARFALVHAACTHRLGHLSVADVAVRVWAAAAHRQAAFAACAWIIDEVKQRVPIWKRETYADRTHVWVACTHPSHDTVALPGSGRTHPA